MTIIRNGYVILFILNVFVSYLDVLCSGFHILESVKLQNRTRRQIRSCPQNQFQCDNGQCIQRVQLCDGSGDCSDGSDENLRCLGNGQGCPDIFFRCSYGACVDGDARCNNVKECFDNSDEAGCKNNTNAVACGTRFTCTSGECIDRYLLCDGNKDCTDGSDETFAICNTIPCQDYFYRCAYGACVDGDAKCNGINECADGSDEAQQICGGSVVTPDPIVTPTPDTGGRTECILPKQPDNGKYVIQGVASNVVPGQTVAEYTILTYDCLNNYGLYPSNKLIICQMGKWSPGVPECLGTCPPRLSESVDTICTLDGIKQDCSKRMVEGTQVTMKCKHLYVQNDNSINPVSVCRDNSWDYGFIKCVPECGKLIPEGTTLIVEGENAVKGSFPWHVGIYRQKTPGAKIEHKCGGSIISTRVVVSAAHCFASNTDGSKYDKNEFYIGAGKYFRDYDEAQDTLAQKSKVKDLIIPPDYKGFLSSFAGDVALVVLQTPFKITHVVQPVCVDWTNQFEDNQLRISNKGSVVGWGFTVEGKTPSKELKQLNVPYIDRGDCFDIVPETFYPFLTQDKFCAGFTNGSSVCNGDSGGGLVFHRPEDNKYYIRGLVSVGPIKEGQCDSKQYGAYTKVSLYLNYLSRVETANRQ